MSAKPNTQDVGNPLYWRKRLEAFRDDPETLYKAVFICPPDRWRRIADKHRQILRKHVQPHEAVVDVGCGWGRLLTLMPPKWFGAYHGVDLSPDFVAMARARYETPSRPHVSFEEADLTKSRCGLTDGWADWAVVISVRPMIRRNLGDAAWAAVEREARRVAARLLYLEYDEDCGGFVE